MLKKILLSIGLFFIKEFCFSLIWFIRYVSYKSMYSIVDKIMFICFSIFLLVFSFYGNFVGTLHYGGY